MNKEMNVYAIVSFKFKGVSSNVIIDDGAKVKLFDTDEGYIYIETKKAINHKMVDEVTIAFMHGQSRLFYNGKIDGIRKTAAGTLIYRIDIPTEVTFRTVSDQVLSIKNQMIQKFKNNISGRVSGARANMLKGMDVVAYEA